MQIEDKLHQEDLECSAEAYHPRKAVNAGSKPPIIKLIGKTLQRQPMTPKPTNIAFAALPGLVAKVLQPQKRPASPEITVADNRQKERGRGGYSLLPFCSLTTLFRKQWSRSGHLFSDFAGLPPSSENATDLLPSQGTSISLIGWSVMMSQIRRLHKVGD